MTTAHHTAGSQSANHSAHVTAAASIVSGAITSPRKRKRKQRFDTIVARVLARACGKIVTRAELLHALYGTRPRPFHADTVLSVAICRARRRLDNAGSRWKIVAAVGEGYMLMGRQP